MSPNHLPTNLAKSLMDGSKKAGEEIALFILDILLCLFILVSFWLYIVSFGRIDLIDRFIDRIWRY